jgi:type II secretory pathway component PulF
MATVGHGRLARWYQALAQHLEAGLSLVEGIRSLEGVPAVDRKKMADALAAGTPVDLVLNEAPTWISETDRQVISAGHTAGVLPSTFRSLAGQHRSRQQAQRAVLGASIYPILVLHFAIVVLPAGRLISGSVGDYLQEILSLLIPLWLFLALLVCAIRWRIRAVGAVGDLLPGIRGYRRYGALRDVCAVLRAFITAGCRLDEAWYGACAATGRRSFIKAGVRCAGIVQAGAPPSGILDQLKVFPPEFCQIYRNGEQTGKLEESLSLLEDEYGRKAAVSLAAASFWYPKILFLGVAVYLAAKVVAFYSGYFEMIDSMMD